MFSDQLWSKSLNPTKHDWSNPDPMFGHRLQCWPNIGPTLDLVISRLLNSSSRSLYDLCPHWLLICKLGPCLLPPGVPRSPELSRYLAADEKYHVDFKMKFSLVCRGFTWGEFGHGSGCELQDMTVILWNVLCCSFSEGGGGAGGSAGFPSQGRL